MIVLPLFFVGLLLILNALLNKIDTFLESHQKILLIVFFTIYGCALFFVCVKSKAIPDNDCANVLQGANYLAGITTEMNWEYFARCNNNIFPMLLLSIILRLGNAIHLQDVNSAIIFINVIQVLIALYCTFMISKKTSETNRTSPWMAMFMLAACLPIIGHTQSGCTDALSFCMSILAFYIWYCGYKRRKYDWIFIVDMILAGIVWGIGFEIKATVIISFIAVLVYLLLFKEWKCLLRTIPCAVLIACIVVGCSAYTSSLPCEAMRNSYGTPKLTYWVGIGLKGNGGYVDNLEYNNLMAVIEGMEAKEDFSKQYILDNLDEFINMNHIIAKTRYNFANGGLGSSDFMRQTNNRNIIYECISTSGTYFWRYCMVNTSYFYTLLILILSACMTLFLMPLNENKTIIVIAIVSVFGIMLYVMLFEANNRQLYNHLPWIIISSNIGLQNIAQKLTSMKRKNRYCEVKNEN